MRIFQSLGYQLHKLVLKTMPNQLLMQFGNTGNTGWSNTVCKYGLYGLKFLLLSKLVEARLLEKLKWRN